MTNLRNQRALTLIEGLVATTIIATLMAGAIYGLMKAQRLSAYAQEKNTAIRHLQSTLDHLQYLSIRDGDSKFDGLDNGNANYRTQNGKPLDIGTEFEEYVGIPYNQALKDENIRVCFPAWKLYFYSLRDYGYVKVFLTWNSDVAPVPNPQSISMAGTVRFKEGF